MLYAFDPPSGNVPDVHWTEILTIIIVTTMLFEEALQVSTAYVLLCMYIIRLFFVYQFFFQDNRSLTGKFFAYFDRHNRLSSIFLILPSYLLFYVGLILRFVLTDITDFSAARYVLHLFKHTANTDIFCRIVMAYDLELWYIRAVLFVGIAPDLGPKLVMIRKMVRRIAST